MNFSDIASVSGKGGLFKVVSPTRSGVILESLDSLKKKIVTGPQAKVSLLSEIAIFTIDGDGSVPLIDVMRKIKEEFGEDTGLDKNSDPDELKSFIKHVLPNYDEEKVYTSDLKKLLTWYNQIVSEFPEMLEEDDKSDVSNDEADSSPNSEEEKA